MEINSGISVNTIIFDYDGTLCEFSIPFLKMRKEIIDFLTERLENTQNYFSLDDRISITGKKAKEFLKKNDRDKEWDDLKIEIEEILRRWEWESAKTNEIYPIVFEILNNLKDNNIKLGIFTLEPKDIIHFLLKKNNIHSFFPSIISRDDVVNAKPDAEHLMKVLEELNSDPKNTLVIGDHPVDMECANNIGAYSIAVLNKRHGIEDFKHCKVNFFIEHISEFKKLLNSKVFIIKS